MTSPYLHDSLVEILEDVVNVMGQYQLGRQLSEIEIDLMVLFLQMLTGEYNHLSLADEP